MFTLQSIISNLRLRAPLLGVMVGLLLFTLFLPNITHAQSVVLTGLEQVLWVVVNVLFGWLVWVGGMLLDLSINEYVIGFGDMYVSGTSGLGNTIDRLWVVVRDIFNLTFIFGLVFIGLRMIFDSSNSSTRKMLVYLIMAALLVNFSLFITKFVIDFSNIAAAQLATAFQVGGTGDAQVSSRFMDLMGLSHILDAAGSFENMRNGSGMGYILGTMILYIIAAFVFLGGGLLLMIRFAVLNIYMVLSPLMFIGWVFPAAAGVTREYWKGFLGRAFFAPAYLLMLYLAQSVLVNFSLTRNGSDGLADLFGNAAPQSFAEVVPPFILTSVFLIAALVVAQKMGANGADGVISVGRSMTGKAKKSAMFASAYVGGAAVAKVRDGVDKAATSKVPVLRGAARVASVYGGRAVLNAGASTYDKARAQTKKNWKEQYARDAAANDAAIIKSGTDPKNVAELARLRSLTGPLSPAETTQLATLEKAERVMQSVVSKLSTKTLEDMSAAELSAIAEHLTSSQVENLMKSDNISDVDKAAVGKARYDAIEKMVGKTGSVLSAELTKLSIDQIESMGDAWITENVHLFSNSQMDDLKKSKKFTENQKNSFVSQRKGWHAAAVAGTPFGGKPTDINDLFEHTAGGGNRKPEDIANLGSKILLDPASQFFITAEALEVIADKKTLTSGEKATLKANLLATPGPHHAAITAYFASPHGVRYW